MIAFFTLSAIQVLRHEWRIVGGLIGALPNRPRQNSQLGLPLLLLPEEVALLLNKGMPTHTHSPLSIQSKYAGILQVRHNWDKVITKLEETNKLLRYL